MGPEDVFAWVYGVLWNPRFRRMHDASLRVGFPRIPPPDEDFLGHVRRGQALLDLHTQMKVVPAKSRGRPSVVEDIKWGKRKVRWGSARVWVGQEEQQMTLGGRPVARTWLKDRRGVVADPAELAQIVGVLEEMNRLLR